MKTPGLESFAQELDDERQRQIQRFGDQRHPNLMGNEDDQAHGRKWFEQRAVNWKYVNDGGSLQGWTGILLEEVYEALAEEDPARLRAELVQAAAVIHAWVYDLDRE